MTSITKEFVQDLVEADSEFDKFLESGGNYFNIFEGLGVMYKENYHSAFIAYLLDTQKEHYQDVFLEKFLEKLQQESNVPKTIFSGLNTENFKGENGIQTEASTRKNRRIDILLTFNYNGENGVIIIENKIFAGDQKAQIRDYIIDCQKKLSLSDKQKMQRTLVIYLHPEGKQPSDESLAGWYIYDKNKIYDKDDKMRAYYLGIDYCWIKEWLESCKTAIKKKASTKAKGENSTRGEKGLDKIIFGIEQYIDILDWYINEEWENEAPSLEDFIAKNPKYIKEAFLCKNLDETTLENYSDEVRQAYEILNDKDGEKWESIKEGALKAFYNGFEKCKIKEWVYFNDFDENFWYLKSQENLRRYITLSIEFESYYKKLCIVLSTWDEDSESCVKEAESIFKNSAGNGIRKYQDISYYEYISLPVEHNDFIEWIMSQGIEKATQEVVAKIQDFLAKEFIQNAITSLKKLLQ